MLVNLVDFVKGFDEEIPEPEEKGVEVEINGEFSGNSVSPTITMSFKTLTTLNFKLPTVSYDKGVENLDFKQYKSSLEAAIFDELSKERMSDEDIPEYNISEFDNYRLIDILPLGDYNVTSDFSTMNPYLAKELSSAIKYIQENLTRLNIKIEDKKIKFIPGNSELRIRDSVISDSERDNNQLKCTFK